MARRRATVPDESADGVIPAELYFGISSGAFRAFEDRSRTGVEISRHRAWLDRVRAAGWTTARLREAAPRDQGYVNWSRVQRRNRLLATENPNDHE